MINSSSSITQSLNNYT